MKSQAGKTKAPDKNLLSIECCDTSLYTQLFSLRFVKRTCQYSHVSAHCAFPWQHHNLNFFIGLIDYEVIYFQNDYTEISEKWVSFNSCIISHIVIVIISVVITPHFI